MSGIDYILLLVLCTSIYTDLRSQKIYNRVLCPALIYALSYYSVTAGMQGVLFSLKGAGLGIVLFLLPYLMGGIGAGDVKLLAIVGVLKGTEFVFYSFILAAITGGIIALFILIRRGEILKTLRRLVTVLKIAILSRLTVWNMPSLNDEEKISFPYGVAIAVGSILSFVVM